MRRQLDKRSLVAASIILAIEVAIALWVEDDLVRPYGGDVLAVVLVFCSLRTLYAWPAAALAAVAFAIACVVELGQALALVARLGLLDNALARTVIGTQFDWADVLAYALGGALSAAFPRLLGWARPSQPDDRADPTT